MKKTRLCCNKKSLSITVFYNLDPSKAPHGDRGNGSSSPAGPPIEPDPGPPQGGGGGT